MIPYEFHITVHNDKLTLPGWKTTRFVNITSEHIEVRRESIITWNQEFPNDQEAIIFLAKETDKLGSNAYRMKVERPRTTNGNALYHEAHFKTKRFIGHPKGLEFLLNSFNADTKSNWCTVRHRDDFTFNEQVKKAREYLQNLIIEQEFESVIVDTNPSIDRDWSIDLPPLAEN
jgi:hypothetical protein